MKVDQLFQKFKWPENQKQRAYCNRNCLFLVARESRQKKSRFLVISKHNCQVFHFAKHEVVTVVKRNYETRGMYTLQCTVHLKNDCTRRRHYWTVNNFKLQRANTSMAISDANSDTFI